MANLIELLVILSITFIICNIEGPFGILSSIRTYLLNNKYCGVFFYKLLSCYFCSGFWSGILYSLIFKDLQITTLIYYGLLGSIISLIGMNLINKLFND